MRDRNEKGGTVAEKAGRSPPAPRARALAAPEKRHSPPAGPQAKKRETPRPAQDVMPHAPAATGTRGAGATSPGTRGTPESRPRPKGRQAPSPRQAIEEKKAKERPEKCSGERAARRRQERAAGIQDLGPRVQPRAADAGDQDQREDPSGRAGAGPGLRLEEIVPDGVIFGYRGYHFRVDLNASR